MREIEIDEGTGYTSFEEALRLVRENIIPLDVAELPLLDCIGYISAEDVSSRVNNPPRDVSFKDGYAVHSEDIAQASTVNRVRLKIIGSAFAGSTAGGSFQNGEAVLITTGAPVPDGADAVVANELCEIEGEYVSIGSSIKPGQNITLAGEEVRKDDRVLGRGQKLTPALISYLAVSGIHRLKVYRKPRFAVISIGDELVETGTDLKDGQIYASNLIYNRAWMAYLGIQCVCAVVPDDQDKILQTLKELTPQADAIITSGGVMHSERDLIVGVMNDLGWSMKFRHVRMGPGKATAFGMLGKKPVFCFSGGPTSNALAFLQFALPGINLMQGITAPPLDTVRARVSKNIRARNVNWTEFREGIMVQDESNDLIVHPVRGKSRIGAMIAAECLIIKSEGADSIKEGQTVQVQILPKTSG